MAGYHPPPNYGGAYPPPVPAPIGFEMANYPEDVPNPGYPPRNDLYGPGYNYGHQQPHQPQPPSQSYDDYGNSTRAEDDRGLPPVGFEGIRHPKQDSDTATASGVHVSERSRPNTDNSRRTRTPEAEITTTEYRVKEETVGSETLFFKRDKKKRIDYVLAFEINPDKDHDWQQKREEKRTEFERNLEKAGLELERVGEEESSNGKTSYIKIHAPWEVLTKGAEEMLMKMPISSNDMDTSDWTDRCFDCLGIRNPFELRNEDLKEEPNYFTCVFRRDRLNKFLVGDRETFFNPAQRSRIVYRILQKAKYGDNKVTQCGIKRLVANGSYTAAYPLHEGSHKMTQSLLTHQPENDRQVLKYCWASPRRWYKMQPLDHIRNYFGEKIGLYFAWLGFYTGMLVPAAFVGLIVIIYGGANVDSYIPVQDICNKTRIKDYPMCPRCDKSCPYWPLYDTCLYSRVTYVFDNEFTPIFAIFMSIWATMFLEFWKRHQAEIAYEWDLINFEDEEERPRVEYETKCSETRINPITKVEEAYISSTRKFPRYICSWSFICFMLALVVAAVLGVVFYRVSVYTVLAFRHDKNMGAISMVTSATAACINLVIIVLLNKAYEKVAFLFTNWEMPRTQTQYEDNFSFKMYLFQFVNYYSSLFYIAFGKLNPGRPGRYNRILAVGDGDGYRQEECNPAGCLFELLLQLFIIMVGKQVLNNAIEIVVPKVMLWWKSRQNIEQVDMTGLTQWEQDYALNDYPEYGLFYEYLEMVIQFGFITIFVTAFPLGPFFALINNLIEIRLDAYKFTCVFRRPMAARSQDIGIWFSILTGVTKISVVVNGFVIAFVSEFVPRLYYTYGLGKKDLTGFVDHSLSCFEVLKYKDEFKPNEDLWNNFNNNSCGYGKATCRFRGYYEPPYIEIEGKWVENPSAYELSKAHWHIVAAKLFFVIAFLHIVFAVTSLLAWLIPDIPKRVSNQVKRENFLAREALRSADIPGSRVVSPLLDNDRHSPITEAL